MYFINPDHLQEMIDTCPLSEEELAKGEGIRMTMSMAAEKGGDKNALSLALFSQSIRMCAMAEVTQEVLVNVMIGCIASMVANSCKGSYEDYKQSMKEVGALMADPEKCASEDSFKGSDAMAQFAMFMAGCSKHELSPDEAKARREQLKKSVAGGQSIH